jgi:hypothetical protein
VNRLNDAGYQAQAYEPASFNHHKRQFVILNGQSKQDYHWRQFVISAGLIEVQNQNFSDHTITHNSQNQRKYDLFTNHMSWVQQELGA